MRRPRGLLVLGCLAIPSQRGLDRCSGVWPSRHTGFTVALGVWPSHYTGACTGVWPFHCTDFPWLRVFGHFITPVSPGSGCLSVLNTPVSGSGCQSFSLHRCRLVLGVWRSRFTGACTVSGIPSAAQSITRAVGSSFITTTRNSRDHSADKSFLTLLSMSTVRNGREGNVTSERQKVRTSFTLLREERERERERERGGREGERRESERGERKIE